MRKDSTPAKGELLKVWNDWSAGMGYQQDDGNTPGLFFSRFVIGAKGMLQIVPQPQTIDLTATHSGHDDTYAEQYFFEAADTNGDPKLYVLSNTHSQKSTSGTPDLIKVDTDNANFGTVRARRSMTSRTYPTGQPVLYRGEWFFTGSTTAAAGDQRITRVGLVAAGAGADSYNETASNAQFAGTHLALINGQMCKYIQNSGVNILKTDGDFSVSTDWGSFFDVGDRNERALGLAQVRGAMFTLGTGGLFSFNGRGRSGLAIEDLAGWRDSLQVRGIEPWKEGLLIAHETGLLYYQPGNPPVSIDPTSKQPGSVSHDAGASVNNLGDARGARYHDVSVAGNNIYVTAQLAPDTNQTVSENNLVMWGQAVNGDPTNVAWFGIGAPIWANVTQTHGIFVAKRTEPLTADYITPILLYGTYSGVDGNNNLAYHTLTADGSSYLPRYRTSGVDLAYSTSAAEWGGLTTPQIVLSELRFPGGVDITHISLYLSDMVSGDEFKVRAYWSDLEPRDAGTPSYTFDGKEVGTPFATNGRVTRPLDLKNIYRLTLVIDFATSSPTSRTTSPPTINQIELYGNPS